MDKRPAVTKEEYAKFKDRFNEAKENNPSVTITVELASEFGKDIIRDANKDIQQLIFQYFESNVGDKILADINIKWHGKEQDEKDQ